MRIRREIPHLGEKFGAWTVISEHYRGPQYRIYVTCKCSCGNERSILAGNLSRGTTMGCMDCMRGRPRPHQRKYPTVVVGQKFGVWTVFSQPYMGRLKKECVMCVCECGTVNEILTLSLNRGDSTGCVKCHRTRWHQKKRDEKAKVNHSIR